MQFVIPDAVASSVAENDLLVGNVYAARGGNKTSFWVVVGVTDKGVALLGIDRSGNIVSATTYGRHVFEGGNYRDGRPILGRVEGIQDLQFEITWGRPI